MLSSEWKSWTEGSIHTDSQQFSLWDVASVKSAAVTHGAISFLAVRHTNATLYKVVLYGHSLPSGLLSHLTFLPTVVTSVRHHWVLHSLFWTISLTDHQGNGLTSHTLNMSQNTVQRSDRNPHFLRYNISTQLICSSMQFIIFILADD